MQMSGFLFLVPSLGFFSFFPFAYFVQFQCVGFLFNLILLFSLRNLFVF